MAHIQENLILAPEIIKNPEEDVDTIREHSST